jgi:hypothetical protein
MCNSGWEGGGSAGVVVDSAFSGASEKSLKAIEPGEWGELEEVDSSEESKTLGL